MENLLQYSASRINSVDLSFKRFLRGRINWNNRLIAITGARGVGKTTLLLQFIREKISDISGEVIFVNADDLYFAKNTIVDFAGEFVKRGGKYLFLDEVHKYKNWSQEIKSCYDYFTELKLIITGSSALEIYKGKADLSRRAVHYGMPGMSLREFIELKYQIRFPVFTLEDILTRAQEIIPEILEKIKPVRLFEEYLEYGYYPFFIEGEDEFHDKLRQTVNQVVETDLPASAPIDFSAVNNIKKLLSILAEIVPYKPNIVKLSQQVGVSRETLIRYLYLLGKADLLALLQSDKHGMSKMNKPDKIYLNNPNLIRALSYKSANPGTMRETFFLNQLQAGHLVTSSGAGDFLVDNKYIFEIGGKNKGRKQVAGVKNAFVASDNIEYAHHDKIPLWLFGFLY
ncbi:MAG: AAA family ATPase [Bacteroidales bacterium]